MFKPTPYYLKILPKKCFIDKFRGKCGVSLSWPNDETIKK